MQTKREPSLIVCLIPIAALILMLVTNILIFKDNATSGPNQMALLVSAVITVGLGKFKLKIPYDDMEKQMIISIKLALQACLILLLVGSLIGIWILSGIVPTMIYYGLELINPNWFLPVACISCSLVALSTGSSWSTAGTLGIALIGIGQALQIPEGMVAGAIVSGSFFGDKMSPMSDTTNLAPAMAGTDLFTHIRHMVLTTGPAIIIAVCAFTVLGFFYGKGAGDIQSLNQIMLVMDKHFYISSCLFLVPLLLILMVAKKLPALPAMCVGILLGILATLFFQTELLSKMSPADLSGRSIYTIIMEVAHSGFSINTGNTVIDSLFNRGGMSSMLPTVWLIMMAMVFGGAMESVGILEKLAGLLMNFVHGTGTLIGATLGTCIFFNMTASDQYLAIVVPGRMFRKAFEDMKLHPKNLSRALEDSATVTSVLVPWNTCGAYVSSVLGVSTLTYLPFCFFNLLSPLVSSIYGATGFTIEKLQEESDKSSEQAAA